MSLLSFFTRSRSNSSADGVLLTVLYATARDGLSSENAFALREIIQASAPLDFFFVTPGSFSVFFPASEEETQKVAVLAQGLRAFAAQNNVARFGVGVQSGKCFVEFTAEGHFRSQPIGGTISQAMSAAYQEGENAL